MKLTFADIPVAYRNAIGALEILRTLGFAPEEVTLGITPRRRHLVLILRAQGAELAYELRQGEREASPVRRCVARVHAGVRGDGRLRADAAARRVNTLPGDACLHGGAREGEDRAAGSDVEWGGADGRATAMTRVGR